MNNDVLKVNDIAIGQNFEVDKYLNGMECIILQDFGITTTFYEETPDDRFETQLYLVEWANGEECLQPKFNLRKKKPKENEESLGEMLERIKAASKVKVLEEIC
jgi:hypothetical protein